MLTPPRFHHLHLRSTDPGAAIGFYTRQFSTSAPGSWAGFPALRCPNDVMILFEEVEEPPVSKPQSAIWHFGWHVTDCRDKVVEFDGRPEVEVMPLYTGIDDTWVALSSDTWFRTGERLGVSAAAIARLRATGTPPPGGPGFAYFKGPDGALFEISGDHRAERFNHVHMWQEDPLCAQLWYQKHFGVSARASFGELSVDEMNCKVPRSDERTFPALNREGMYRAPRGGVTVGDVDLIWYANQGEEPLASSAGQLQDHIAFSVSSLDAWVKKLDAQDVTFLCDIHPLGNTRAVLLEGPSREQIELVEAL